MVKFRPDVALHMALYDLVHETRVCVSSHQTLPADIHSSSSAPHPASTSQLTLVSSPERILFELPVLTYRCLHGSAPGYLASDLQCISDLSAHR